MMKQVRQNVNPKSNIVIFFNLAAAASFVAVWITSIRHIAPWTCLDATTTRLQRRLRLTVSP
jgi:hypothetical protein